MHIEAQFVRLTRARIDFMYETIGAYVECGKGVAVVGSRGFTLEDAQ